MNKRTLQIFTIFFIGAISIALHADESESNSLLPTSPYVYDQAMSFLTSDEFYATPGGRKTAADKMVSFLQSESLSTREREQLFDYYLLRSLAHIVSVRKGKVDTWTLPYLYKRCWQPVRAFFSKKFMIRYMFYTILILFPFITLLAIPAAIYLIPPVWGVCLVVALLRSRLYKEIDGLASVVSTIRFNTTLREQMSPQQKKEIDCLSASLVLNENSKSPREYAKANHTALLGFYNRLIARLVDSYAGISELQEPTIQIF